MISVDITAAELLGTLKDNMRTHVSEYEASMKGYRTAYISAMKNAVRTAEKGGDCDTRPTSSMMQPQSHEDDYKRAISMVSAVDGDHPVTLNEQDYARLVMDEWDWKHEHVFHNQRYTGNVR